MQPYFMPYLGYWQLINEVDVLVISDDTKYTKQSWINRNRVWKNGRIEYITIPIRAGSDSLRINQREIASTFSPDAFIRGNLQDYQKCNNNKDVGSLMKNILYFNDKNLSRFLINSIEETLNYLNMEKRILIASELAIPNTAKGQERIFYLSQKLGITGYVNLPGGKELYSRAQFENKGISIEFIVPKLAVYETFNKKYEPGLSMIDMLFNVDKLNIRDVHMRDYNLD